MHTQRNIQFQQEWTYGKMDLLCKSEMQQQYMLPSALVEWMPRTMSRSRFAFEGLSRSQIFADWSEQGAWGKILSASVNLDIMECFKFLVTGSKF